MAHAVALSIEVLPKWGWVGVTPGRLAEAAAQDQRNFCMAGLRRRHGSLHGEEVEEDPEEEDGGAEDDEFDDGFDDGGNHSSFPMSEISQ